MKSFIHNNVKYTSIIKEWKEKGVEYVLLEGKREGRSVFSKVTKEWATNQSKGKQTKPKKPEVSKEEIALMNELKRDLAYNEGIELKNKFINKLVAVGKNELHNTYLNKGKYLIDVDFVMKWGKKDNSAVGGYDHVVDEHLARMYTVKNDNAPLYRIVEELVTKHSDEYYYYTSDRHTDIKTVKYGKLTNVDLKQIKMKATKLAYKLLGNVQDINMNDGQCVLDYIMYEANRQKAFKKLTRNSLVRFFGDNCIKEGISTEQIIQWAERQGNVTVHALNPFFNEFATHLAVKPQKLVLCFIVNNHHCYPIVDSTIKKSITENKTYSVSKVVFDIKYDDFEYVENVDDKVILGTASPKKVVLVESNNLVDMINEITEKTGQLVYNMKFNKSRVVMFEHPVSNQIYVASEDYAKRKQVCEDMKKELQLDNFKWRNQSWTQLANTYFVTKFGTIPKSDYSTDVLKILTDYKIGPIVMKFNEYTGGDIKAYDIGRCYTSVMIDNQVNYNIFSIFSQVSKLEEADEILEGEYYVSRRISMTKGVPLSSGWYPYVFIKHCLENNYITRADITYKVYADTTIPANTFKQFAEDTFKNWRTHSKMLNNNFIGDLNTMKRTVSKGCVTDSLDIAIATFFSEQQKGLEPAVHHVNNLYFLRVDEKKQLSNGHIPIWRHIIASAYIKLDKLIKTVAQSVSKIYSVNTDCVVLSNALNIKTDNVNYNAGDYRTEEDPDSKIRGRNVADLEEKPFYEQEVKQWKDMKEDENNYDDVVTYVSQNNVLVNGEGGSGKTEMIKKTMGEKDICFTFTHKACENLKARGVKNCHIFDSYFFDEYYNGKAPNNLPETKTVYVDEIMCVPSHWIRKLVDLKRNSPQLQFRFFGDNRQTEPVEKNSKNYDYENTKTIMELCDYNRVTLKYKFTRYDITLYDVIQYFNKNNKLPVVCKDKKVKDCWINLAYTNNKRKEINEKVFKRYVKENNKKVVKYQGVNICVGLPIIALWNSPKKGVFNSRVFTIVDITNEGVMLNDNIFIKKKDFTFNGKKPHFDYAFCMTVHKFQGSEIKEDYCIYEIERMDKKLLYTALTRGASLDKVHFNYTNKVFTTRVYKNVPVCVDVAKPNIITGRIYAMTNDNGQAYVGSTTKAIEKRYQEHKEEAVNKNMKDFMATNPEIICVAEIKYCDVDKNCLLRLEDEYIKQYSNDYEMMNCKINIKNKDKATKQQVVKIEQTKYLSTSKFNIQTLEKKKIFRILYTVDGERKEVVARWAKRTKEEAYKEITQKQKELEQLYS